MVICGGNGGQGRLENENNGTDHDSYYDEKQALFVKYVI